MQNPEEPDAEPGAECRTPCCQFFGGNADFEVNFLALKEETDGIFLSYTVVQCTPSVCDALAKSRNEFYQASQSHKVVLHRLPLKQEPTQNLLYIPKAFFSSHFVQGGRATQWKRAAEAGAEEGGRGEGEVHCVRQKR